MISAVLGASSTPRRYTQLQYTNPIFGFCLFGLCELFFLSKILPCSGPIQWARGDVGLKPSAAARPWALADCEWRTAASGLKPLRLPRAPSWRAGSHHWTYVSPIQDHPQPPNGVPPCLVWRIGFGRGERLTIWWVEIANHPPTQQNQRLRPNLRSGFSIRHQKRKKERKIVRVVSPRMRASPQTLKTIFTHRGSAIISRRSTVRDSLLGPKQLIGCSLPI